MDYKFVLYDTKDKIATITLNRPEKLNALSEALQQDLAAAIKEASEDD